MRLQIFMIKKFLNLRIKEVFYNFLAVVMIDSALKKDENYYPQVILKECKYIEKEVIRHITED